MMLMKTQTMGAREKHPKEVERWLATNEVGWAIGLSQNQAAKLMCVPCGTNV